MLLNGKIATLFSFKYIALLVIKYLWILIIVLIFLFFLGETEDICIVERLFSSSLVAIVSLSAPRKLKVCHFKVKIKFLITMFVSTPYLKSMQNFCKFLFMKKYTGRSCVETSIRDQPTPHRHL